MRTAHIISLIAISAIISSCCKKVDCSNNPLPKIHTLADWSVNDTVFIFEYCNNIKVNEHYLIYPKNSYIFNDKFHYQISLINRVSIRYEIKDIKIEDVFCGGDCLFSKSDNKVPSFVQMIVNGNTTKNGLIDIK